jgi:hypothetical protein
MSHVERGRQNSALVQTDTNNEMRRNEWNALTKKHQRTNALPEGNQQSAHAEPRVGRLAAAAQQQSHPDGGLNGVFALILQTWNAHEQMYPTVAAGNRVHCTGVHYTPCTAIAVLCTGLECTT